MGVGVAGAGVHGGDAAVERGGAAVGHHRGRHGLVRRRDTWWFVGGGERERGRARGESGGGRGRGRAKRGGDVGGDC